MFIDFIYLIMFFLFILNMQKRQKGKRGKKKLATNKENRHQIIQNNVSNVHGYVLCIHVYVYVIVMIYTLFAYIL